MSKEAEDKRGDTVISLDLETTGLSTARDRIVEYALVRRSPDGTRKRLSGLVNPGMPIPEVAMRVHKITDAMVRDAKPFAAVAPAIFGLSHSGRHPDGPQLLALLRLATAPSASLRARRFCHLSDIKRYAIVEPRSSSFASSNPTPSPRPLSFTAPRWPPLDSCIAREPTPRPPSTSTSRSATATQARLEPRRPPFPIFASGGARPAPPTIQAASGKKRQIEQSVPTKRAGVGPEGFERRNASRGRAGAGGV